MVKGPEGTVALVTGGYRNLGYNISKGLKEDGYTVIATYRSDHKAAVKASMELDIPVYKTDMSIKKEVLELFSKIEADHGKVSILVNNVSTFPTGPLQKLSHEDFEDAFKSTVFASNLTINRALLNMLDIGWGRIINIGMSGAHEIKAYRDIAAHASAKTALSVLTLSWAFELKNDGITVNMVMPGMIDYPWREDKWREDMKKISSSGCLTSPVEVATAVVHLANRGDITGRLVRVDPIFNPSSL